MDFPRLNSHHSQSFYTNFKKVCYTNITIVTDCMIEIFWSKNFFKSVSIFLRWEKPLNSRNCYSYWHLYILVFLICRYSCCQFRSHCHSRSANVYFSKSCPKRKYFWWSHEFNNDAILSLLLIRCPLHIGGCKSQWRSKTVYFFINLCQNLFDRWLLGTLEKYPGLERIASYYKIQLSK